MNETYSQLENLVQGSIQIADHMQMDASSESQLQQIRGTLQHIYRDLDDLSRLEGDSNQHKNITAQMHQHVLRANEMLQPLKSELAHIYQQETDGSPDQFEVQSLHQQQADEKAYHGKIDFLSAEKLQENLDKIDNELKALEGRL